MLETRSLVANVKLDMTEFRKAMMALKDQGWTPALLHAENEFLRLAGLNESLALRSDAAASGVAASPEGRFGCGEVFFRGDDMYYCLAMNAARRAVEQQDAGVGACVEAGIISVNPTDVDRRLGTFSNAVEMAARKAGQKASEVGFDWAAPERERKRLAALEKPDSDVGARFASPHLDRPLVKGAQALADPLCRRILAEMTAAGFVRTRDILAHHQQMGDAVSAALGTLRSNGLIVLEHLLECRKYGTPLTRLNEPARLDTAEVGTLVCPSCGASFRDEAVSEGYAPSELGVRLNQNRHWLTVLTMYRLFELGVPADCMMWNISDPGNGVDVAAQFLGRFWTFELKEGEFGPQDVLSFNYRRARYSPDKALIVAVDGVSPNAKRLFAEFSGAPQPVFIEGLDRLGGSLQRQVDAAALSYACHRLHIIEEMTGYDISTVVASRFEHASAPPRKAAPAPAASANVAPKSAPQQPSPQPPPPQQPPPEPSVAEQRAQARAKELADRLRQRAVSQ